MKHKLRTLRCFPIKQLCVALQGWKKPRSDRPGQANFALGVKMEVWWSSGKVKLASVVLLVMISNQNNELKAWINLNQAYLIIDST